MKALAYLPYVISQLKTIIFPFFSASIVYIVLYTTWSFPTYTIQRAQQVFVWKKERFFFNEIFSRQDGDEEDLIEILGWTSACRRTECIWTTQKNPHRLQCSRSVHKSRVYFMLEMNVTGRTVNGIERIQSNHKKISHFPN